MKLAFLTGLFVSTALALPLCPRADAQVRTSTGTCKFNEKTMMKCTVTEASSNGAFTLRWSDGISDTYHWVGANSDRRNLEDVRGGSWHYHDYRNCRDYSLTNVDNGNVITFIGDTAACK